VTLTLDISISQNNKDQTAKVEGQDHVVTQAVNVKALYITRCLLNNSVIFDGL